MPELPEVETVVRTLESQLGQALIKKVHVRYQKVVENMDAESFADLLAGQRFEAYGRRGKYLIFTLSDYVLVAHLRMEGKFYFYRDQQVSPDKHTHVVFDLDSGQLHYHDTRKFGRFNLYKKGEPLTCLAKLGKEPWDESLNGAYLRAYCRGRTVALKTQLLDQQMICGIGNIYANEACYAARLDPHLPVCLISETKWDEILGHVRRILEEAIACGGTTVRDYTSQLGVTGRFQVQLNVHGRENEPCVSCKTAIVKVSLNGRGTYYCPHCQKEKASVVGITGSIGSGKSTVSELIAQKGYPMVSCDTLNHEILAKEETSRALAGILNCEPDRLSSAYIADRIFSDPQAKREVETYLHGKIREEIASFISNHQDADFVFVEVPLLFEVGWDKDCDRTLAVVTSHDKLVRRLKRNRHLSDAEIERRLANQLDGQEKARRADEVIYNDGDKRALKAAVNRFLKKLTALK